MIDRLALGCGNFGGIGSAPELFGHGESDEEAFTIMDAAWRQRIRWFDTADAYGGGRSELAIGRWIASRGDVPRITTKTFNPMGAEADSGLSRARIRRQIASSLERLGVERVDLYLAHEFDPDTPLEETMETFEELAAENLVGTYGVSNFDAAQLERGLAAGRPAVVQNEYSLLARGDEDEVLPLCAEHGVAYQAFSPLAGGWLTGKYRRGEAHPPGSRMTLRPGPYLHLDDDRVHDGLERFAAEAADRNTTMAALAIAWVLTHPSVAGVVVGPRRPEQLEPALAAARLDLSQDDRAQLSSLFDR